jgi:uncharacterized protein YndB with AHSA1/START domain
MEKKRISRKGSAVEKETELVVERVFDAPRERVWQAWSDPELLKQWWGPKNFSSPSCRMDFKEGGSYLFCMRSPEGRDFWSTGKFLEISNPERLVYIDSFADEKGNQVPPSFYGMPGDVSRVYTVTVTLEENIKGKTKLNLRHLGLPGGEHLEMARAGWHESMDKLGDALRRIPKV